MARAVLTVTLAPVTPIFMGGARPATRRRNDELVERGRAEFRPPSLKGLLRQWYRAIDPDYRRVEPAVFGGAGKGAGQAPFLMALPTVPIGTWTWNREDVRRFEERSRETDRPPRNGAGYVGFSLATTSRGEQVQRHAIPAASGGAEPRPQIVVNHYLSQRALNDPRILKALYASWWLLAHVGGLGTRSRRGFGTVKLLRWSLEGAAAPANHPPLPADARDLRGWWEAFVRGLDALRAWYPGATTPDHLVLDDRARFLLLAGNPATSWLHAVNIAGRLLQDFRQCGLDYPAVNQHLAFRSELARGAELAKAPAQAAFGLPVPFSSRGVKQAGGSAWRTSFAGSDHDRSASRIWLRIVSVGNAWFPMVGRLSGPLLAPDETIVDREYFDRSRQYAKRWAAPGDALLDRFCDDVARRPNVLSHPRSRK